MPNDYRVNMAHALEIDDIVSELADAFKWARKRKGTYCKDQVTESVVTRRLAIGCVKRIHIDMHAPQSMSKKNYLYPHTNHNQCREELLRLCGSLRYTQVEQLLDMGIENSHVFPHYDHELLIDP